MHKQPIQRYYMIILCFLRIPQTIPICVLAVTAIPPVSRYYHSPITLTLYGVGNHHEKIVLGSIALIALGMSAPAVAADMAVKAKAPPPAGRL